MTDSNIKPASQTTTYPTISAGHNAILFNEKKLREIAQFRFAVDYSHSEIFPFVRNPSSGVFGDCPYIFILVTKSLIYRPKARGVSLLFHSARVSLLR
jgi:hypothetical protein